MHQVNLAVVIDDSAEPTDFDRLLAAFLLRVARAQAGTITAGDDSRTLDLHEVEATS